MEKTIEKKIKKFTSRMQARLLLVFCVITILLFALVGRLIYLMQVNGDSYAKHVLSRQSYVSAVLPYKRGDILDRNGTVLARSELQYKLILDPENLIINSEYITSTQDALTKYFSVTKEEVQQILDEKPDSRYVILLKNLKYDAVKAFKDFSKEEKNIKGVWFEEEYVRAYPYNSIACDLIGFTSTDNIGYFGLEEYYNEELNGINGREYGYYDETLNVERITKEPVNGNTIVSTIDLNTQRIIQEHIATFNEETGSKSIGVIVMDPNNGDILAMASNQEYNLNDPRNLEGIYTEQQIAAMSDDEKLDALNAIWKNDVISNGFEPGSTFKPVTIAAALEEALITDNTTFVCDGGEHFGGSYIKCNKRTGHGQITLAQALMLSCNDALMQIVAKEGKELFYSYQENFGYGAKTGIDLPGEAGGILYALDQLKPIDLAISSFGQTFTATMIQMASAYSSLVNGGNYYEPHVMKRIVNDDGATVDQIEKLLVRKTVSKQTSDLIQKYTYQTVEAGTAKTAKVEGYAIGGKTGTAQKYPRGAGTYVVSFIGQVPAINPEVVIYVAIDEPQNVERQDNSAIATNFAAGIMKEILPALGIFPEGEIDYLLPQDEEEASQNGDNSGTQTGNDNVQGTENSQNSENNEGNENTGNNTENNENSQNGNNEAENEQGDTSNQEDLEQNGENNENINQNEEEQNNSENSGDTENTEDTEGEQGTSQNGDQTNSEIDEDEFNGAAID
ncbi:MAG: hypothetical protein K0S47_1515 [Herbinix sp.]|jgi:stage V sporulation protein D (sporulation-specific penicillin-binding protein)|nr:hypothetical protein [Herbinix sp.]